VGGAARPDLRADAAPGWRSDVAVATSPSLWAVPAGGLDARDRERLHRRL